MLTLGTLGLTLQAVYMRYEDMLIPCQTTPYSKLQSLPFFDKLCIMTVPCQFLTSCHMRLYFATSFPHCISAIIYASLYYNLKLSNTLFDLCFLGSD